MDSVFEKFTLYDLVSYFVPGLVFMCLVCGSFLPSILIYYEPKVWDGLTGYAAFVFLVFSYVMGIAISSVSAFLGGKILTKPRKLDETGLERALLKSGLQFNEIVGREEGEGQLSKKFASYIYADIQTDPNYKRIHNYASSETLYKNLSGAFLMGGLVTSLLSYLAEWPMLNRMEYIYVWEAIMTLIFLFRWKRFREKKMEYAVRWFVGKYLKVN